MEKRDFQIAKKCALSLERVFARLFLTFNLLGGLREKRSRSPPTKAAL